MFLLFALACGSSGKINGEQWPPPAAVHYDLSQEDRLMVVMSDLPSLCAELASGEPPRGNYWVMSLWTQNRSLEPGEYQADGYFLRADGEELIEWTPSKATINISSQEEELLSGGYEAKFGEENFLAGSFDAPVCDGVYLFSGMGE